MPAAKCANLQKRLDMRFIVATPYSIEELSEAEEREETYQFLGHIGFDCLGCLGDARINGRAHCLWEFASSKEAERFIREWGGVRFPVKPLHVAGPVLAPTNHIESQNDAPMFFDQHE